MYCECGCGQRTPLAKRTRPEKGHVQGQPCRFAPGHGTRTGKKARRFLHAAGYVKALAPDHPRADQQGYVLEHILIAERALGKPLSLGTPVHHFNGDGRDNRNRNLVVCQDEAYHKVLHIRQKALAACGNASWRMCRYCRRYDSPKNLFIKGQCRTGGRAHHRACHSAYETRRRHKANGEKAA